MGMPYEQIYELKKQLHCNIPDLLVEARQNDPFYAGCDILKDMALWFRKLWDDFDYTVGIHLRRVHYQILSQRLCKHDGTAYENTESNWVYLCTAGAQARYLRLVDPPSFLLIERIQSRISSFGMDMKAHQNGISMFLATGRYLHLTLV